MSPPVHVCLRALALFSYQLEVRACAEKKKCVHSCLPDPNVSIRP